MGEQDVRFRGLRAGAVKLLVLAPYAASALLPALTPARALLLAWLLEAGSPPRGGHRPLASFALRHASAWWLLHVLRPDAAWLVGAAFLAIALLAFPWWSCRTWKGGPALRAALVLAVLGPVSLGFLLELGGREVPGTLTALDPWSWAGVRAEERRPLPVLAPGLAVESLPFRLPARLFPTALEDSPALGRARLLLGALLVLQAAAVVLAGRSESKVLLAAALFPWAGVLVAEQPDGVTLHWQESAAEGGRALLLEVHGAGSGLWDPLRGPLVPGPRALSVRAEREAGIYRVVSGGPWAVLRTRSEAVEEPEEPAAWLERHPLRAERSGGPAAGSGGLGVLRLWARGEAADGGGVRWVLGSDGGTLHRRPLP